MQALCWSMLGLMSLGGLRLSWWIWTVGLPEKYAKPLLPSVVVGPITLDSDWRGLIT